MGNVLADASGPAVLVDPDLVNVLASPGCDCALPVATCPHALCFEVNPASEELSDGYWDSGYVAALRSTVGTNDIVRPYIYIYDSGGGAYIAGCAVASSLFSGPSIEVPTTLADFFGKWHCVTVKMSFNTQFTITLEAYGSTDTANVSLDIGNSLALELFIGSQDAFPGTVDLQIKNIKLLANPGSAELDFIFPVTSFDSTVGSGQSISGDTVLVSNTDGGRNGYVKELTPNYDMLCPCSASICDDFTGMTTHGSVTGTGLAGCSTDGAGATCEPGSSGGWTDNGTIFCGDGVTFGYTVRFFCGDDGHYGMEIAVGVDGVCTSVFFDLGVGDPRGLHTFDLGEACYVGSGRDFIIEATVS